MSEAFISSNMAGSHYEQKLVKASERILGWFDTTPDEDRLAFRDGIYSLVSGALQFEGITWGSFDRLDRFKSETLEVVDRELGLSALNKIADARIARGEID